MSSYRPKLKAEEMRIIRHMSCTPIIINYKDEARIRNRQPARLPIVGITVCLQSNNVLALKISFSPACTLSSALTVGGEWGKQRIVCMSEQSVCIFEGK